jgi:hypothetical protein
VTTLLRVLATLCAVACAILAYPTQRHLAGAEPDTRVAQMQLAHAVMLITASGFTWPRDGDLERSRAWLGFVAASSFMAIALIPFAVSPPQMFLCSAVLGAIWARRPS